MTRRATAAIVAGGIVLGVALWLFAWRGVPGARRPDAPPLAKRVIPEGTRVKVEVLNGTDTRGLARIAAAVLRDAGFDVVYFGNANEKADSTIVRVRTGHADWAQSAAKTMAPAAVVTQPDSSRLVDLTVLVGARWRPPPEPLRP